MVNHPNQHVVLTPEVHEFLHSTMKQYADQGDECAVHLFGKREQLDDGSVVFVVACTSNVGPKAECRPSTCRPDLTHGQHCLDALRMQDPEFGWTCIGESHVHPMPLHQLSITDEIALGKACEREPYLAILLSRNGTNLRMQAFVAQRTNVPDQPVNITRVPIEIDHQISSLFKQPKNVLQERMHVLGACVRSTIISFVTDARAKLAGQVWVGSIPYPRSPMLILHHHLSDTSWCTQANYNYLEDHDDPNTDWNTHDKVQLEGYIRRNSDEPWTPAFANGGSSMILSEWASEQIRDENIRVRMSEVSEHWRVMIEQDLLKQLDGFDGRVGGRYLPDEKLIQLTQLDPDDLDDPIATCHPNDDRIPQLRCVDDVWTLHCPNASIKVESWDRAQIGSRQLGIPQAEVLRNKRVVLAGLGSIGSRLAMGLAACGVKVLGFDRGIYKAANAYPRYPFAQPVDELIGRRKADILMEYEQRLLGSSLITGCDHDLCTSFDEVSKLVDAFEPDLAIISTDTADSRIDAGVIFRQHKAPQLHAGFSDGAASVELAYYGSSGVCPACRGMPGGDGATAIQNRSEHYGVEQHAVAALHANIELGAAVTLRAIISLLAADDCDAGAQEVFSNHNTSGDVMWLSHEPDTWLMEHMFQKVIASTTRDEQCPVCSPGGLAGEVDEHLHEPIPDQAAGSDQIEQSMLPEQTPHTGEQSVHN